MERNFPARFSAVEEDTLTSMDRLRLSGRDAHSVRAQPWCDAHRNPSLRCDSEELRRGSEVRFGLQPRGFREGQATGTIRCLTSRLRSFDIPVLDEMNRRTVRPLSKYSNVVANLRANNQVLLYVKPEGVPQAKKIVKEVVESAQH